MSGAFAAALLGAFGSSLLTGCAGGPLVHRRAEPLRVDEDCRARDLEPGDRITLRVEGLGWLKGVYEGVECGDPQGAVILFVRDASPDAPGDRSRVTLSEVTEIRKANEVPEGIRLGQAVLLGGVLLLVVIGLAGGLDSSVPS
jgi:hypothetical protein